MLDARADGRAQLIGDDDHGDEAPARRIPAAARPGPDGAAAVRNGPGEAVHAGLAGAARRVARVRQAAGRRRTASAPGPGPRPPADRHDPFPPVKLLLTPYREVAAGEVRREVRERLPVERRTAAWRAFGHAPDALPRVVYNLSTVAATLHFEDLVRVVLPMTEWWHRLMQDWTVDDIGDETSQRWLAQAIKDPEHPPVAIGTGVGQAAAEGALGSPVDDPRGGRADDRAQGRPAPAGLHEPEQGVAAATEADWLMLVRAVATLVRGVTPEPRADGLLRQPQPRGVADGGALDARHQGRRGAAPVRHLVPGPHLGGDRQRHRRAAPRVPPRATPRAISR